MALPFRDAIRKWNKKNEKKINKAIQLFLVDFSNRLIGTTVVGDPTLYQSVPSPNYRPGTLINSWFTTYDSPYTGPVRQPNTSGADAIAQARVRAKTAAGELVFFSNPTPYAHLVEFGVGQGPWSVQPPFGRARIAVAEIPQIMRKAVANVK